MVDMRDDTKIPDFVHSLNYIINYPYLKTCPLASINILVMFLIIFANVWYNKHKDYNK